ncbi:MAG: hypothetical protein DRN14_07880, partial [Thermoplasmata archaeon]
MRVKDFFSLALASPLRCNDASVGTILTVAWGGGNRTTGEVVKTHRGAQAPLGLKELGIRISPAGGQMARGTVPYWAALLVWAVVNAVNLLQSAGFASRVITGSMHVNHLLGYAIMALVVPAAIALWAFVSEGASWLWLAGPVCFICFVLLMLVVDYLHPVEFRNPPMPLVLVPYLVLFFGGIVLMGIPMLRFN